MAAPPKPWEKTGPDSRVPPCCAQPNTGSAPVNFQNATMEERSALPVPNRNPMTSRLPPALPNRNQTMSSSYSSPLNQYGSYGSGYNSYGYGGSSMFGSSYGGGMYSQFGSGMYGNRYGYGGGFNNQFGDPMQQGYSRFLQQAEASSRPAFQSIESIVGAFASVSMMFESTYHTVYNCFRAVLGVADHFSRLKIHMSKIIGAIAILRFLRYIYRRLLVLLRLREASFAEEVWKEAQDGTVGIMGSVPTQQKAGPPSWPIYLFFAVVVGGPYVIWRLLSSMDDQEQVPEWASGEEDHVVARAEYDFDAESTTEISFKAGSLLNLAPKELQPRGIQGWLIACADGQKVGLVPANYIKVQGKRRGNKHAIAQSAPGAIRNPPSIPSALNQTNDSLSGLRSAPSMSSTLPDVASSSTWDRWGNEGNRTDQGQGKFTDFDTVFDDRTGNCENDVKGNESLPS